MDRDHRIAAHRISPSHIVDEFTGEAVVPGARGHGSGGIGEARLSFQQREGNIPPILRNIGNTGGHIVEPGRQHLHHRSQGAVVHHFHGDSNVAPFRH